MTWADLPCREHVAVSGYTTDCHDGYLATETHAAVNCPTMTRKAPSKGKSGFKMLIVLRFRNPAARNHGPLDMGFVKTHDILGSVNHLY